MTRASRLGLFAAPLLVGTLLAAACGSLDKPTVPDPAPEPSSPVSSTPAPGANATPPPVLAGPAPKPSPTPTPEPGSSPAPTPTPGASSGAGCGDPVPPALSQILVKVHQRGDQRWLLDSTPLVGPDPAYCAKIGFTDGRSMCPVRVEGHPEREACELLVTGRASDTGRPGPTWFADGSLCTGPPGCLNSPDNQYQVFAYQDGLYKACGQNNVCGDVIVDR